MYTHPSHTWLPAHIEVIGGILDAGTHHGLTKQAVGPSTREHQAALACEEQQAVVVGYICLDDGHVAVGYAILVEDGKELVS